MRTLSAFLCLVTATAYSVLAQGYNYELMINGERVEINLDEAKEFKTAKGEKLSLLLKEKDILTYTDNVLSFSYHKGLSVSKTAIDDGIEQLAVMNASGSGFLLQKYETLNPSSLIDLMTSELIKESVNYGYKKSEEPFQQTLKSGQVISGKKTTLEYNGDYEYYTVVSYGNKDAGILLVLIISNSDYAEQDAKIFKLLLDTLVLK